MHGAELEGSGESDARDAKVAVLPAGREAVALTGGVLAAATEPAGGSIGVMLTGGVIVVVPDGDGVLLLLRDGEGDTLPVGEGLATKQGPGSGDHRTSGSVLTVSLRQYDVIGAGM